ncbi:MAG: class I SAM-dependent RNA methyltransferase [Lachnospiraceae bacterium]|nr:class I SAM-dependent RNA methyltransferase [Lachnospiraceae bacterium]
MGCPHFGSCGGCDCQDLTYEEQLTKKEREVMALLFDVVQNKDCLYEKAVESPLHQGYRNKMEFTFGNERKDGPLTLGLHRKKSFFDILPVTECNIVDADFRRILTATTDYFGARQIPFFHRKSHEGYLRHLLVRKGAHTGEILIDLVTTWNGKRPQERYGDKRDFPVDRCFVPEEDALLAGYVELLQSLPFDGTLCGILHTRNDSMADVIRDEGTDLLYGRDYFFEELLSLLFRITPFSFFQTNSLGAEALYSVVREYVLVAGKEFGNVYDLYSGTGTIAQLLSPVAAHVTGVEIVEEAVAAARDNAEENGLSNCTFYAGDVLKVLDDLTELPDLIVLDPPRDGVQAKALSKILQYGVPHIVYVSCKPTSLARDLVPIQAAGYSVERVRCVDMFPFTRHVETAVLLQRNDT